MTTTAGNVPVVLLHALPLNSAMWEDQTRALTARGHTVLAPDQRGYGSTPLGDEPPSLDVVADDVARLLDARGIGRVVLAGSSMGGYVAMAFLRRHPHRVRALALMGTRAGADNPQAAAERRKFADLMLSGETRGPLVARTTPLLLGETTRQHRPDLVDRVTEMAQAADPEAVAWSQNAIAARPDSFADLAAADVPALVLAGTQDALVPVEEAARMAEVMPRARFVTLPETGHLQPLEAPERVSEALLELIDDIVEAERKDGETTC